MTDAVRRCHMCERNTPCSETCSAWGSTMSDAATVMGGAGMQCAYTARGHIVRMAITPAVIVGRLKAQGIEVEQ